MAIDFKGSRQSYEKDALTEERSPVTPYALLETWFKEAVAEQIGEAYAFSLATCGADMRPSVRTLLMREIVERDDDIVMIFYSNYDSDKGQDLAENPHAQGLFFWADLERQVRISGKVERLSREKSQAYFHSRPLDSQVAAWVSQPQSGVVDSRETLDARFDELTKQFGDSVPLPDFWGGYAINVDKVEFWQGRANRMHDRLLYQKNADNPQGWDRSRLMP